MTKKNVVLNENLPSFQRKGSDDKLADLVNNILYSQTPNEFYFQISQIQRGGTGKDYQNRDKLLPSDGRYSEFEVNGSRDARRIVINMDTLDLYITRNHYKTMQYAGKVII